MDTTLAFTIQSPPDHEAGSLYETSSTRDLGNFIVLTGGPGVGKTTLIEELSRRGFSYQPEVARTIIREQVTRGGIALPWKDKAAYADLMLSRSVESIKAARQESGPRETVFFDRGIPDIMAYVQLSRLEPSSELMLAVEKFRYFRTVFLLPPWAEIFVHDTERKQSFTEAVQTDCFLREAYLDSGYRIVEVPKSAPSERADFVLRHLTLLTQHE